MSLSAAPSSMSTGLLWCLLLVTAVAGPGWWWSAGRAVELPAAPLARIACVSYAPFRRAGQTPFRRHAFVSPAQIDADLRALSQRFDCIRTYSQGEGLAALPAIAQRYGMKVLLGIWLGRNARKNAREIALGIASARARPQLMRGVIVGNEVLLRGELSPPALAAYIHQVRAGISASIPVSYADVWENWLRYRQLAAAVDELTIHVLPYWEDRPVAVGDAVRHVAQVYAYMRRSFPGRPVLIGETGWPSAGRSRRGAVPGLVNEARYLRAFLAYADRAKIPYNVIEAFDQPWKRDQEGTVGGYWGIFDAQANPKFSMRGPVTEVPYAWLGVLAALMGGVVFGLAGSWRRPWYGVRGRFSLVLAGLGSGSALAWQVRQIYLACTHTWQWTLAAAGCALALYTALSLARVVAAHLAMHARDVASPDGRWRFAWLFALAFYSLLEVFDGRYRDFPLGLFALPCVAYAALGLVRRERAMPCLEQRFLAGAVIVLGTVMVGQEHARNLRAWLWLGLCLALALPLLTQWWVRREGQGLHVSS